MDIVNLLIQLVCGAVGGNLSGVINKARSLSPVLNTVLGAIGGLGGGQLLGGPIGNMLGSGTVGNIGASGVVGLLLPLVVSYFQKKKTA